MKTHTNELNDAMLTENPFRQPNAAKISLFGFYRESYLFYLNSASGKLIRTDTLITLQALFDFFPPALFSSAMPLKPFQKLWLKNWEYPDG